MITDGIQYNFTECYYIKISRRHGELVHHSINRDDAYYHRRGKASKNEPAHGNRSLEINYRAVGWGLYGTSSYGIKDAHLTINS